MEFLLLIEDRRDEAARAAVDVSEMGAFARGLAESGALVCSAGPLQAESEGALVRVRNGRVLVTDGPFAETKEIVCGYFVVRAESRDAAIAIAARCPYARAGAVLVREAFSDCGEAVHSDWPRFLLLTREGPEPERRDGEAEYANMMAFVHAMQRDGRYVEGAGLPRKPRAARVEIRAGQTIVHDGPFAEAKEIVGGLMLIEARDRAEAIALAARCAHAAWGSIEVRGVQRLGASQPGSASRA